MFNHIYSYMTWTQLTLVGNLKTVEWEGHIFLKLLSNIVVKNNRKNAIHVLNTLCDVYEDALIETRARYKSLN